MKHLMIFGTMFIDDPTSYRYPPPQIEVPQHVIEWCDNFTVDAERDSLRFLDCLWYKMGYYRFKP